MNSYMARNLAKHKVRELQRIVKNTMGKGKTAGNLSDAIRLVTKTKSYPFGTFYYAQDLDGKICSYSTLPSREPEDIKWSGDDKRIIQNASMYDEWHNTCIKYDGKKLEKIFVTSSDKALLIDEKEIKIVEPKPEVAKQIDGRVSFSDQLVARHPERGFKELPADYGIASAYLDKVSNSKSRNINFELGFDQFKELFNIKKCAISGNELEHFGRCTGMDQFSMDRVDPARGYVMDNILIMAADLNAAKSDLDKFLLSEISDEYKLEILNRASHALRLRGK